VRWARISPIDFWIAVVVAVFGLTAGLLPAVALGVVVTLVLVLREINTPRLIVDGPHDGTLVVHLDQGLYTANALANERAVVALAASRPGTERVVLDLSRQRIITMTVLEALEDLDRDLAASGVELRLRALPEKARAVAARTPWFRSLDAAGRVRAVD
jgi:MFS superfamily sulfate permease-like transporter